MRLSPAMKHASALVLLSFLICAACSVTTVPLRNIDNANISGYGSKKPTLEEVQAALSRAAEIRGWTIEDISPGHAIGRILVRGKHSVTIDITYTTETMSMTYVDSSNMDFRSDSDGEVIHLKYNAWINNLLSTLRKQLAQM